MNKELFSDFFWIIILIVCGFGLILLYGALFGTNSILIDLLGYLEIFTNILGKLFSNPFVIILSALCFLAILFLMSFEKFLK